MANISTPHSAVYYRIEVRNPEAYTGSMYYNHVSPSEVYNKIVEIQSHSGNEIVKLELIDVRVTVTDIPGPWA